MVRWKSGIDWMRFEQSVSEKKSSIEDECYEGRRAWRGSAKAAGEQESGKWSRWERGQRPVVSTSARTNRPRRVKHQQARVECYLAFSSVVAVL